MLSILLGKLIVDSTCSWSSKFNIHKVLNKLQVNGAGDHVLRSLLGSLVHYYPMDQYKYASSFTIASDTLCSM